MFGFGTKRKLRKIADSIGVLIHQQLRRVLTESENTFSTPEEIAFTSGYLSAYVWNVFDRCGCKDIDVQNEHIKYLCDGVLPGRLWDVFQRGKAIKELAEGETKEEYARTCEAYEIGERAGLKDASEEYCNRVPPQNLANYLLGRDLVGVLLD